MQAMILTAPPHLLRAREDRMLKGVDKVVVLPCGFGTIDELMYVLAEKMHMV